VIFVCEEAEKNCPYLFPYARRSIKMPFEDPAAFSGSENEKLEKFRSVRDEIKEKMKQLAIELERK
jgi:arsenate reductase